MLTESFLRGARPKIIVAAAILLGAALITALFSFTLEVGDKIGFELRRFGANLAVIPQGELLPVRVGEFQYQPDNEGAFIAEDQLVHIKQMFWRHNVLAFAPYLTIPVHVPGGGVIPLVGTWFNRPVKISSGEVYTTGVRSVCSWWAVTGDWVSDADEEGVLVGEDIARQENLRVGDLLEIRTDGSPSAQGRRFIVRGLLRSGGEEDKQLFVSLPVVQKWANMPGKVRRVQISALTKPEDALARKDPKQMTPKEYDLWYCSPYISSIAYQLKEAIPGIDVRPIRQVVEAQGAVLSKTEWIVTLVTLATLFSMALAVASTTSTTILKRRGEIALMKAIGASNAHIIAVFLVESALLGLLGGLLGFGAGIGLAQWLGQTIFGTGIPVKLVLLPMILAISGAIAMLGSSLPLRAVLRVDPVQALHGG